MCLGATCTSIVLLMLGKCVRLCLNAAHISCGHAVAICTSDIGSHHLTIRMDLELGGGTLIEHLTIFPGQSLIIEGELTATLAVSIVLVHLSAFV